MLHTKPTSHSFHCCLSHVLCFYLITLLLHLPLLLLFGLHYLYIMHVGGNVFQQLGQLCVLFLSTRPKDMPKQANTFEHSKLIKYLFSPLASSTLYLANSKLNLSLQALPVRNTGLPSAEKYSDRVSAIEPQSWCPVGRCDITSVARAMSWRGWGHLKGAM